jgi:hypothetical protein
MFFNVFHPSRLALRVQVLEANMGSVGDPPFTQYGPAQRPANATQMCALVANANHSIMTGTGNCVDLPQ